MNDGGCTNCITDAMVSNTLTASYATSAGTASGLTCTNCVALTTETTGNYAAGNAEAGAALTGDSATAFFSTGTIEDARLSFTLQDAVNDGGCTNCITDAMVSNTLTASYATAANTIPVRNANGYLYLGWLNTLSGETTGNPTHYFVETTDDSFLRQSTPANMVAQLAADGLMPKSGGTFTGYVYARDHGTASTDMIVNVVYGTGSPPTPTSTTIGTLWVKYT
ncbi:hypothetical protein ES703_42435 [subsurface metagenome]